MREVIDRSGRFLRVHTVARKPLVARTACSVCKQLARKPPGSSSCSLLVQTTGQNSLAARAARSIANSLQYFIGSSSCSHLCTQPARKQRLFELLALRANSLRELIDCSGYSLYVLTSCEKSVWFRQLTMCTDNLQSDNCSSRCSPRVRTACETNTCSSCRTHFEHTTGNKSMVVRAARSTCKCLQ